MNHLPKALQEAIDRAQADRESETGSDDGIGRAPDKQNKFELQSEMEYEPEMRTLGSLTAADLGKTITVNGLRVIAVWIKHFGPNTEVSGRATDHYGPHDTPCEVTP